MSKKSKKTKKGKRRWSLDEMRLLLKYRTDGLSNSEIGKKLDRSEKSVKLKIDSLNKDSIVAPRSKIVKLKVDATPASEALFPTEAGSKPFFAGRKISKRYIALTAATVALIAAIIIERLM
jgi:hypothetical protein